MMKYDFFLSYAHEDADVVRELAGRLKADGVNVWFDEDQIRSVSGVEWAAAIERGLSESRTLVAFLSKDFVNAEGPKFEYYKMRFRDPLNKNLSIIAIRLDDTVVPGFLHELAAIDWRTKSDPGYQSLLEIYRRPWIFEDVMSLTVNNQLALSGFASFSQYRQTIGSELYGAKSIRLLTRTGRGWWSCFASDFLADASERKKTIDLLVVDPRDDPAFRLAMRTEWLPEYTSDEERAVKDHRDEVTKFLDKLTHPSVSKRVLRQVPAWTILIIEPWPGLPPQTPRQMELYVELMTFRSGSTNRPMVKIGQSAGGIFDLFWYQFEEMWRAASPWPRMEAKADAVPAS